MVFLHAKFRTSQSRATDFWERESAKYWLALEHFQKRPMPTGASSIRESSQAKNRLVQGTMHSNPDSETSSHTKPDTVFKEYLEIQRELHIRQQGQIELSDFLRKFCFESVPRGPKDNRLQLPAILGGHYYRKSASELFMHFFRLHGAAMCHGNSYALHTLFNLYGFESFIFNTGLPPNLTHAFLVVYDPASERWVIQDGHFGLTAVDRDSGRSADFFSILAELGQGQSPAAELKIDNWSNPPYLAWENRANLASANPRWLPLRNLPELATRANMKRPDLYRWLKNRRFSDEMAILGQKPEFLSLLKFPISVWHSGGSQSASSLAILSRIKRALSNVS